MIVINEIENKAILSLKEKYSEVLFEKRIDILPVEINPKDGEKRFIIDPDMLKSKDWEFFFQDEVIEAMDLSSKIEKLSSNDFPKPLEP